MKEQGKDQLFLEFASDLAKFYATLAHCLRFITEEGVSEQMPLDQVKEQFSQLHVALKPRLDHNRVVSKKVQDDYQTTLKLIKDHGNPNLDQARREELGEEALRLHYYGRERSTSISDLVAVFKSL